MALTKCCGCCSLQKGTIIVALINFVFGVIAFILLSTDVSYLFSMRDAYPNAFPVLLVGIELGLLSYNIIELALTGTLLIGAVRRISSCVFLGTCMNFSNIIITFAYMIWYLTIWILSGVSGFTIFIMLICIAVAIGIQTYLWLVIYYFYQELVADKFRTTYQHNTVHYPHPMAPEMVYGS